MKMKIVKLDQNKKHLKMQIESLEAGNSRIALGHLCLPDLGWIRLVMPLIYTSHQPS
jgi:hypothetical protein